MDQARIKETIVNFREFRGHMAADLAEYEAGTHYTGEIRNGQRIDTTRLTIAELKRRITKVDNLIAAYKKLLDA
jgi:hypothetical protein